MLSPLWPLSYFQLFCIFLTPPRVEENKEKQVDANATRPFFAPAFFLHTLLLYPLWNLNLTGRDLLNVPLRTVTPKDICPLPPVFPPMSHSS